MQVPPIPNQRSDAVCSSTLNRKALGGNRLNAHSRLLEPRSMTCDICDCDFLGTGGEGVSYNPFSSWWIFCQPIWKICASQIGSFPWKFGVFFLMKPPPNPIFGKRLGVPQPNLLRNSSFIIRSSLASMGYRLNFHEFAKKSGISGWKPESEGQDSERRFFSSKHRGFGNSGIFDPPKFRVPPLWSFLKRCHLMIFSANLGVKPENRKIHLQHTSWGSRLLGGSSMIIAGIVGKS